jgi:hypothetical protein
MSIAEEYEQERKKLELDRKLDWSTFSRDFIAAGEKLEPMTVQIWFDLLAIKSPLLYGGQPTVDVLTDYVWRNKASRPSNKWLILWGVYWLKKRIIRTIMKEDEGPALIHVIHEHVKSSLDEFPSVSGTKSRKRSNSMSPISGEASMIDELAHRYGTNPEDVLKMPVRRAFALQRIIRSTTIPGYKLLEPDSLRAIKSKFLNNINNGTE